jgi:hypothetical protein
MKAVAAVARWVLIWVFRAVSLTLLTWIGVVLFPPMAIYLGITPAWLAIHGIYLRVMTVGTFDARTSPSPP